MIYRSVNTAHPWRATGTTAFGATLPGSAATAASAGMNPLLGTMQRASEQMDGLQRQVDQWMVKAHARTANAREAREWLTALDDAQRLLDAGGEAAAMPEALRAFVVRNDLMSSTQASGPMGTAALRSLRAGVQSVASGAAESSTVEQIELKQFLSRYENTLTLSNAVIAKLRDIMSRITQSL